MDGLGALWATLHILGDVEPYAGYYGKEPPDVTDRDVFIVDFSYPRATLLRMQVAAKSLLVLDHHATAKADLEGFHNCVFDQTKSGAVLTWDYLNLKHVHSANRLGAPLLLRYIQDRDLWQWLLPNSRNFNAYLRSRIDFDAPVLESLATLNEIHLDTVSNARMATIFNEGARLEAAKAKMVESVVKGHFFVTITLWDVPVGENPVEYFVPTVFCHHSLSSEVGNELAKLSDCGVGLILGNPNTDRFGMSFRGIGNDLAKRMAIRYGGGGHDQAAGASLNSWQLSALISTMKPKKVTA